jgi:quinoprotein glucose dehydrogenase
MGVFLQTFESIASMNTSCIKQLFGCLLLAFLSACSRDKQDASSVWTTFGHDVSNNKFSALTDIDTSNVTQLQEAWRYEDTTEGGGVYFNPVMTDNRVIGLMPSNKLVALDAATGKLLWQFIPDSSDIPNWSKGNNLSSRQPRPDLSHFRRHTLFNQRGEWHRYENLWQQWPRRFL